MREKIKNKLQYLLDKIFNKFGYSRLSFRPEMIVTEEHYHIHDFVEFQVTAKSLGRHSDEMTRNYLTDLLIKDLYKSNLIKIRSVKNYAENCYLIIASIKVLKKINKKGDEL